MKKYFNTTGPCNPQKHYMLDAIGRLEEVISLIEGENYFVIHAARQSGKTTLLLELSKKLNAEGNYYALYCSLENTQGIIESEKGIPSIVKTLKASIKNTKFPGKEKFALDADYTDYSNVLRNELSSYCAILDKPLVIFFDEADCLSDDTLISFLRQLRNGYNIRSQVPFVHSLVFVGMRNIRDFKAKIRPDQETLGSASPFNIVSESLTMENFSKEDISNLYHQHTDATGQIFEKDAIELVYQKTSGQPWLVNAIARELVLKIVKPDFKTNISPSLVEKAIQNIILRRDTHIDSLLERLKEERVRKVIEPIIIGESGKINISHDDTQYCLNLGLIKAEEGELLPANKIYNEVIIRALNYDTQFQLEKKVPRAWIDENGIIDMSGLLHGFQEFWRENSEIWEEKYEYKEAAPHLILQAYLQRIINGGGYVIREYASGRERMDLCVVFQKKKYPIELKLLYSSKTVKEGIIQISNYMETLGEKEAWLILFDRNKEKSWPEKIYWRTEKIDANTIHILGC